MKALLLEEYKKLTVTDMPDPEFGDHEVLVKSRPVAYVAAIFTALMKPMTSYSSVDHGAL